jgi:hypothetical protein
MVRRRHERPMRHVQGVQGQALPSKAGDSEKSYRVVSVSLYADQAEMIDKTSDTLLKAGFAKANRSLVIQTAIQRLREDLEGKSPSETVMYFLERQMRRPLALASSRSGRTAGAPGRYAAKSSG